jgi:hypothetical protein
MDRIKGGVPEDSEKSEMAFAIRSYPGPICEGFDRGEEYKYILPIIFSRVMLSNGTDAYQAITNWAWCESTYQHNYHTC